MNIKSLIEASEMSQTKFAKHLGIPLRTVQNWATEKNKCPDWTTNLIKFRLKAEGVITMYDIIAEYTNGMAEEESKQMIRNVASEKEWELWQKYLDDIKNGEIYDGIEYMIDEIPSLAEKIVKLSENEKE